MVQFPGGNFLCRSIKKGCTTLRILLRNKQQVCRKMNQGCRKLKSSIKTFSNENIFFIT